MSFVTLFGPELPYLRRYARALTGSQQSGDAYIRAALTALSQTPEHVDGSLSPRIGLFKFFHAIWDSTGAQLDKPATDGSILGNAEEKLLALAPIERQAFLLTSMEGFTYKEAAHILNVSDDKLVELCNLAIKDIETSLATKVLIIEDEPIISADLASLVESLGHEVTGQATTHAEAVEMATHNPPGLVLCDIQLADNSSGIDAAQDILAKYDVPIIFITAFPERLLTGERPEPTYLISKPFQENTVKAAIGQALFFHPDRQAETV